MQKRKIKFVWDCFCMVSACSLFVAAMFTTAVDPAESIEPETLWQILLISLLCAVSSLIYPWDRTIKKAELCIRAGIHYLIINSIVLGAGGVFGWYRIDSLKSVVFMLVSIAVIFAVVSAVSWSVSAKDARRMNEKLAQYQHGK